MSAGPRRCAARGASPPPVHHAGGPLRFHVDAPGDGRQVILGLALQCLQLGLDRLSRKRPARFHLSLFQRRLRNVNGQLALVELAFPAVQSDLPSVKCGAASCQCLDRHSRLSRTSSPVSTTRLRMQARAADKATEPSMAGAGARQHRSYGVHPSPADQSGSSHRKLEDVQVRRTCTPTTSCFGAPRAVPHVKACCSPSIAASILRRTSG